MFLFLIRKLLKNSRCRQEVKKKNLSFNEILENVFREFCCHLLSWTVQQILLRNGDVSQEEHGAAPD